MDSMHARWRLARVNTRIGRLDASVLSEYGLTPVQFNVLEILVHDEVGFLLETGGWADGKLILTDRRLVFVMGGGFFGPKQRTEHAVDLSMIDNVSLEPADTLGIRLRVDFTTREGPHTVRYHCRIKQAEKIIGFINYHKDSGILR